MTRMKYERLRRLLTQEALAKRIGIPRTVLSELENWRWIRCPPRCIGKLMDYFGMSFDELMQPAPPSAKGMDRLRAWQKLQKRIA